MIDIPTCAMQYIFTSSPPTYFQIIQFHPNPRPSYPLHITYPCRCLCRGLTLHRIYTLPFRFTLRQCKHIFRTAERTFIPRSCWARMDGEDTGVVGTEDRRGRRRIESMKGRSREKLNIVSRCLVWKSIDWDELFGDDILKISSKPGTRSLNLSAHLVRFMRISNVEGSSKGVPWDLLEDTR